MNFFSSLSSCCLMLPDVDWRVCAMLVFSFCFATNVQTCKSVNCHFALFLHQLYFHSVYEKYSASQGEVSVFSVRSYHIQWTTAPEFSEVPLKPPGRWSNSDAWDLHPWDFQLWAPWCWVTSCKLQHEVLRLLSAWWKIIVHIHSIFG